MSDRIDQIKERLAKATDGPWKEVHFSQFVFSKDGGICELLDEDTTPITHPKDNATFIANSPSDIQFLLKRERNLVNYITMIQQAAKQAVVKPAKSHKGILVYGMNTIDSYCEEALRDD